MIMWNGDEQMKEEDQDIPDDTDELLKPFQVTYRNGLVENFSTEATSVWSTNIKRSIAGILQLDLSTLEKETAFHSTEVSDSMCNRYFCTVKDILIVINILIL